MSLIGLLVFILILLLIFGLIFYFIDHVPVAAPFNMWIKGIVALICIVLLLSVLFGGVNIPVLRIN
jgi:hypothetical protein